MNFWFNYIKKIKNKRYSLFCYFSQFRGGQHFFKWYGGWFRKQLKNITHIFVQNNESLELLKKNRCYASYSFRRYPFRQGFSHNKKCKEFSGHSKILSKCWYFIVGSSWPPDEEYSPSWLIWKTNYKFIIAPHVVDKPHIASLWKK